MTRASIPGADSFTGEVHARLLRRADAESALAMYEVTFTAAARTHWHAHPRGQALLVTAGRARVQIDGQQLAEYGPGDFVWTPPGVRHWHGAAPNGPMTHVTAQEAAPDGATVTWWEVVSDATYAALPPETAKDDH